MTEAFDYIKNNHGLCLDSDYKYNGKQNLCSNDCLHTHNIKSYFRVKGEDYEGVLQKGPISIAVDATNWVFYKEGIFDDCEGNLNHAVVLVGYNNNCNDKECNSYWIVRNSWGTDWGENGYIYVKKGEDTLDNTCGILNEGVVPMLE